MKQRYLIILVALIAIVAGSFFLFGERGIKPDNEVAIGDDQQKRVDETYASITEAQGLLKGAKMCSFTIARAETSISGTLYQGEVISGGDVIKQGSYKIDFNSEKDGISKEGSLLNSKYFWSPETKKGIQVNLFPPNLLPKILGQDMYFDFNEPAIVNCADWKEDNDILKLPTDIDFVELSVRSGKIIDQIDSEDFDICIICNDQNNEKECREHLKCSQ